MNHKNDWRTRKYSAPIPALSEHRGAWVITDTLLYYEQGHIALANTLGRHNIVSNYAREREDRAKTITAISGFKAFDPKIKIVDLMNKTLKSKAESLESLSTLHQTLSMEIAQSGDKKIHNPEERSSEFIAEAMSSCAPMPETARELVLQILARNGIDESEITPTLTLGEACEIATFRNQLQIIASGIKVPFEILKQKVSAKHLPHRVINDAFEMHGQKPKRRAGSDLNDKYLASISCYADIITVDKRTAENFRIIHQKSPITKQLSGTPLKAKDYSLIPKLIAELSEK